MTQCPAFPLQLHMTLRNTREANLPLIPGLLQLYQLFPYRDCLQKKHGLSQICGSRWPPWICHLLHGNKICRRISLSLIRRRQCCPKETRCPGRQDGNLCRIQPTTHWGCTKRDAMTQQPCPIHNRERCIHSDKYHIKQDGSRDSGRICSFFALGWSSPDGCAVRRRSAWRHIVLPKAEVSHLHINWYLVKCSTDHEECTWCRCRYEFCKQGFPPAQMEGGRQENWIATHTKGQLQIS